MNQGGWGGAPGQPGGGPQPGYAPAPQAGPPGAAPQQGYGSPPQAGPPQAGPPQAGPPQQGYPQQPQQGYAQPAYAPAPPAPGPEMARGFLSGLIDFSFTTFIATKVIKVIYGLALVAIVLGMLGSAWTTFDYTFLRSTFHPEGFLQFVLIPLGGAAAVVAARIYCELLVVIFRIADNLVEINRKTKA
jgi:hypothetical protein